ncbi:hypothetical protein TNCV_770411 [Trichonephila clavipes]|nr:hypothetical protein TNCV_770411 [Trichonephila clavipes]
MSPHKFGSKFINSDEEGRPPFRDRNSGTKREKFVASSRSTFERGSHSRVERGSFPSTKRAQHEKKPKTLPLPQVSDRGLPCHEFEPSTTKDPPCRVAMRVKSVELKRPPVGVVVRRGGASSGVVHVT